MILWFIGAPCTVSASLVQHLQLEGLSVRQSTSDDLGPGHPCLLSTGLVLTDKRDLKALESCFTDRTALPLFLLTREQEVLPASCTLLDASLEVDALAAQLLEGLLPSSSARLTLSRLVLDRTDNTCILDGEAVGLTELEFEILWVLAEHAGKVVSSVRLLSRVWGLQHDPQSNRVAVYVKRLRDKLPDGLIQTQRGKGYRLRL